ncbi:glycosyltransferase family 4 protein [Runella sp.]|uniref:glycosyltransferase family 4 protein n=1 Tax=Runella sp. TaxID=1960881 RepID=UPI003D0D01AB
MKKILFISHDANRAGGQIVLLQLLRQLKQHNLPMHLLLCSDGPLEEEFKALVPTTRLPRLGDVRFKPFTEKLLSFFSLTKWAKRKVLDRRWKRFTALFTAQDFGLIFANTIGAAAAYRQLDFIPAPTVLFAHELEMSIRKYSDPADMEYLMSRTNHLIVVSKAVASYFQKTYHYPESQISTFQIIDTPLILKKIAEGKKVNIRQKMGLPADAVLIGGCGHAEWRKGNDIFMMVAQQVIAHFDAKPVYFVWVGMRDDSELYEVQRFDAERMGLSERIIHVGLTSEVFDYLSQFDVFALTSREDPYPLVVLEAALAEKPIVCFEKSGGAPELVEEDAGFVVPYLDSVEMSKRIIELIESDTVRSTMGQNAKRKVLERHPTAESVEKVVHIIKTLCE